MFALYDTVLSYGRDVDDELNIVGSGLLTGVTYSAPHGLKRMAKGGFIGLALTLTYLAYTRRELFASLRFEDKTKNYWNTNIISLSLSLSSFVHSLACSMLKTNTLKSVELLLLTQ